MSERRSDPEDGAASRPCWASPSSPASPGSVGLRPHTRWAPGPGPGGARGSAARPSPVPGCPALRSGLRGAPGLRPPLRGRLARARLWRLGPRPLGLRLPLRGTARFVPRSLARPSGAGPCASLRRALPPGVPACGRVLGPASPPLGWLRPGLSAGPSLSGPAPRPPGLCGLPGRSPLARLRARLWPFSGSLPPPRVPLRPPPACGRGVLALRGSARARCARGAARPCGPLLAALPPPGLGVPGRGVAAVWRQSVVNDGRLRGSTVVISAR